VVTMRRLRSLGFALQLSVALTLSAVGAADARMPDGLGYVVADPSAVERQLAEATGTRLAPLVEFVEASPAIGPWVAGPDHAQPFLSYSVDDLAAAGGALDRAGMRRVSGGRDFAFFQGSGGQLVRLIERATTAAAQANQPVAISLFPCEPDALKEQLTTGLGISWRAAQPYPLVWMLPETGPRVTVSSATISQGGDPFVAVEPPHGFPLEDDCSPGYTPAYLVFATADVEAAGAQMARAGMRLVARSPGLIGIYRGVGGVSVEAVNPVFIPNPIVPSLP